MIKLEHTVLASPEQMEFIIEGMRNPMNSWDKSDSHYIFNNEGYTDSFFDIGKNDRSLMQKLSKAGTDHRKFMRMMPVMVRITAPLYWWKEFDTYKVGTVANSCSTMHKIMAKEFELSDFSTEKLGEKTLELYKGTIIFLNFWRYIWLNWKDVKCTEAGIETKEDVWNQVIQLLPSSYNQTRNVMLNYEVLHNMYHARKNHKLDEWREFCKWIEQLPYRELITGYFCEDCSYYQLGCQKGYATGRNYETCNEFKVKEN